MFIKPIHKIDRAFTNILVLAMGLRASRTQNKIGEAVFHDCNWTRTQNHLVRKRTLNHLVKLVSGNCHGVRYQLLVRCTLHF